MQEGGWLRYSPPWPGQPYSIWCPDSTAKCEQLNTLECFEPEQETLEVLSSLLLHCERSNCTYVDVGCNLGLYATYAARLGASVQCFEPMSTWTAALERTASAYPRFRIHQAAVFPHQAAHADRPLTMRPGDAYRPCGIGKPPETVTVPRVSLHDILREQAHTSLLKIDIDSLDGALLTTATDMISRGTASIDSILVELGCFHFRSQLDPKPGDRAGCKYAALGHSTGQQHPRGGDVHDLWRLQRLGYDVYRLRTHTNQDILDWRGADVNRNRSTPHELYVPMRHVRAMKKLEWLPMQPDSSRYSQLVDRYESFLITRVQLAELTKAQSVDLNFAHIKGGLEALNQENPALRPRDRAQLSTHAGAVTVRC